MKINKALIGLFIAINLLAFNVYWMFYLDIKWYVRPMLWFAGIASVNALVYIIVDLISEGEKPDEHYYYASKRRNK